MCQLHARMHSMGGRIERIFPKRTMLHSRVCFHRKHANGKITNNLFIKFYVQLYPSNFIKCNSPNPNSIEPQVPLCSHLALFAYEITLSQIQRSHTGSGDSGCGWCKIYFAPPARIPKPHNYVAYVHNIITYTVTRFAQRAAAALYDLHLQHGTHGINRTSHTYPAHVLDQSRYPFDGHWVRTSGMRDSARPAIIDFDEYQYSHPLRCPSGRPTTVHITYCIKCRVLSVFTHAPRQLQVQRLHYL